MSKAKANVRHEFPEATKQLLARRAGFRCSICQAPTVGPHSEPDKAVFLGEACHIHSAAPAGPRANAALKPEQCSDASNGIHLCKTHARLIDTDVAGYPAEKLRTIKSAHEEAIRTIIMGPNGEFDPDFLNSHQTQVIHGRGSPSLNDLWVARKVIKFQVDDAPTKADPISLLSSESGVVLVIGDQWTGRTCLLKRMAASVLTKKNCAWIDARSITETHLKDPIKCLASGYKILNGNPHDWKAFLAAPPSDNLIFIDDLHLSTLNVASKRRFLSVLQTFSQLIVATVSQPFVLELLALPSKDNVRFTAWQLLDLSRADCAQLVEKWCRFGAESVADDELDYRIASTESDLEVLFGKKLLPRQPLFVLTALQGRDAGSPLDNAVGSFGAIYQTVIHLALAKNANQAAISNERAYLEELAFWGENEPSAANREVFNKWFADRKGIHFEVLPIHRTTNGSFLAVTIQ